MSVCLSVCCRSVCLLVTFVSPAKTAEPIEMPFGMQRADSGGPKKPRIIDRGADPQGRENVEGRPIATYRDTPLYRNHRPYAKRLNRSTCV